MEKIQEQKQANKFLEGGIFYPTGHIVTAFASAAQAARARDALLAAGFDDEHVQSIDDLTMAREAEENLDDSNVLSVGASLPTREKQLELAQEGCHFLLVYAPDDGDDERLMQALSGMEARYAVKYHRLIIENLLVGIADTAPDSEPARVP